MRLRYEFLGQLFIGKNGDVFHVFQMLLQIGDRIESAALFQQMVNHNPDQSGRKKPIDRQILRAYGWSYVRKPKNINYKEACGKNITTGCIIAYQSYGDMLRFNPHFHCIILEGGIDNKNDFYHIRLKDLTIITEAFRQAVG